jgi:hypothetical protein
MMESELKPNAATIVPAQTGWSLLCASTTGTPSRYPVIAWLIEDGRVYPITVNDFENVYGSSTAYIKSPDGVVFKMPMMHGERWWDHRQPSQWPTEEAWAAEKCARGMPPAGSPAKVMDAGWLKQLERSVAQRVPEMVDEDQAYEASKLIYESPLEKAMALAMCIACRLSYPEIKFHAELGLSVKDAERIVHEAWPRVWAVIFPQVVTGDYRVDFLIMHPEGAVGSRMTGTIVECDGHEFHEKTKDQAARDKARDRDLQIAGYTVLHYTGSEIWNDPIRCASDALGFAHGGAMDAASEQHEEDIRIDKFQAEQRTKEAGMVNGAAIEPPPVTAEPAP